MKNTSVKKNNVIIAAIVTACLATPLVSTAAMSHYGKGHEDGHVSAAYLVGGEGCGHHEYESRKGGHHRFKGGDAHYPGDLRSINPRFPSFNKTTLTAEQIKQLDTLKLDYGKKMVTLRAQLQTLNLELDNLYGAGTLDTEKIRKTSSLITNVKSELYMLKVDHGLEQRALLLSQK